MTFNTITHAQTFNSLPINTGINGEYSCYTQILEKLYKIMTYMTNKHCRVLFIRFDVRFPQWYRTTGENDEISHLFKMLKENSKNMGIDFQFLWAREQSQEKHQHYHCITILDGSRVRSYHRFLSVVTEAWGHVLGCEAVGLVDWCDRDQNGIRIDRPQAQASPDTHAQQTQAFNQSFSACFYWGSYLAKENQKANTPKGVRRYGASQLK